MTTHYPNNRSHQGAERLKALRNILEMETTKGFQDKAVTGGLEAFLSTALRDAGGHPALKALADHGMLSVAYASLDVAKRERWVRETQRMLEAQLPPPPSAFARDRSRAQPEKAPASASPKPAARTQIPEPRPDLTLDSPVTAIRGVTRQNAGKLAKLGLHTVRDLVFHFPNRHIDYSARRTISRLRVGEDQTVVVSLWEANQVYLSPRIKRASTVAAVGDETGNMRVIWFNQPWVAVNLQRAMSGAGQGRVQLALSGKVSEFNGRKQLESPEWELLDDAEGQEMVHTGRLVPVYPKTEGLYDKTLRNMVRRALAVANLTPESQEASKLVDSIPGDTASRLGFMPLPDAIWQTHYPDSLEKREQARQRLAFDELLTLLVAMGRQRRPAQAAVPGIRLHAMPDPVRSFLGALPFQLTDGQQQALDEATADIGSGEKPMSRLLQGDVGSGKTVVAVALLLTAVAGGYQGALMAPTEVLAEQHFLNIRRLLSGLGQPGGGSN
ncbi:MAG: DEAD/DEAH box helicase, partial [Dehalococcoidia bacterium]